MGKVIVFSAPSGAGKTTIAKEILKRIPALTFSISACSRDKRPHETYGVDYYFLSQEEFKQKIKEEAFLEWEEVYHGNFYGTLKSEIDRIWQQGNHVIFDVDTLGGMRLKEIFKQDCLSIFIQPPSVAELEKRLRSRNTETEDSLSKRMARAEYELSFAQKFDKVITNSDLEQAIEETYTTIASFVHE